MAGKWDFEDPAQWYFIPGPRMILTIPILLLFGLNALWYFLLAFLVPIDLFLWNILFFFLFGLTVSWFIGAISGIIASLALVFGLSLLQWFGMPLRATGWWYGIAWGF